MEDVIHRAKSLQQQGIEIVAVSAANALTNDIGYFKKVDYKELLNKGILKKI